MTLVTSTIVVIFTPQAVQGDTIDITASVPAPPLEGPAIITSPKNKARSLSTTITVSGTCPDGSAYVTLTRNDVSAGVTSCNEGLFSLPTSLVLGVNNFVAHAYNITNNPGPVENTTTVYFDLPEQASLPYIQPPPGYNSVISPHPSDQCAPVPILLSHEPYSPIQKKKQWQWTVTLQKGCPPYTLTITWGDGVVEKHEIQEDATLSFSHTYEQEGYFRPLFEVEDSSETSATLQLLAIINPEPSHEAKKLKSNDHNATDSLPPLITIAAAAGSIVVIAAVTLAHHYGRLRK